MKMGVGLPAERRAAVLHHEEAGRADDTPHPQASSVSDVPINGSRFEVMRCRSAGRAGGAAVSLIAPKCKLRSGAEAFPVVKQALPGISRGSRTRD